LDVPGGFTGIGHDAFIALDFAVVSEVLPDAETSSAKNLGVFNVANAQPQSLAPAQAPLAKASSHIALHRNSNQTLLVVPLMGSNGAICATATRLALPFPIFAASWSAVRSQTTS
jgi:hypothetical protein